MKNLFEYNNFNNIYIKKNNNTSDFFRNEYFDIFISNNKVGYFILSDNEYDDFGVKEYFDTNDIIYLSFIEIDSSERKKGILGNTITWLKKYLSSKDVEYLVLRIDNESVVDVKTLESIYIKLGFKNFEPDNFHDLYYQYSEDPNDVIFMYLSL